MRFQVQRSNTAARLLYERLGYRLHRLLPRYYSVIPGVSLDQSGCSSEPYRRRADDEAALLYLRWRGGLPRDVRCAD